MHHPDRIEPPQTLRAVAAFLIRGRNAESVLDDLEALWLRDVERGVTRWRAALRYCGNGLGSMVSLWRARFEASGRGSERRAGKYGIGVGALGNDVRLAIRRLGQERAFSIAAIGTLSIGIGATTAIFGAINTVLLDPLPYRSANDIYTFSAPLVDGRWSTGRVAMAEVSAIDELAPSVVATTGVFTREDIVIGDGGETRVVLTRLVTQGFFEIFDGPMESGRSFAEDDYDSPTAVVAYGLWQSMLGGGSDVVGQVLHMGQGDYTIVGVAPLEFDESSGTEVWIGYPLLPTNLAHTFEGFLRVAEGTDPSALDDELSGVMTGLAERYPQAAEGRIFVALPLLNSIVGNLAPILILVMSGAGIVLVLASVNVAVLVLARGRTMEREVAVRTALGAGRLDLVRRLVAESLVVACLGTIGGLGLARLGVELLARYGASQLPRLGSIPFDEHVLLFSVVLLGTATVMTGLAPSFRLLGTDVRGVLGEGGRTASAGRGTNRLFGAFVVAEVALAMLLVSGAGWMLRSYTDLSGGDVGFIPERRLVFTAFLTGTEWAPDDVPVQGSERWVNDVSPGLSPAVWANLVRERIGASDRVASVGSAGTLPLNRNWEPSYYVAIANDPYDAEVTQPTQFRGVDPSFFEASGTRLLAGRLFGPEEPAVALVNEAFVQRYLAGRDALDQALHFGFPTPNLERPYQIVGVVEDAKYESLAGTVEAAFYLPFAGARQSVVVETTLADPSALIPLVRAEVAAVDPDVPVSVVPYDDVVSSHLVRHRMGLTLMSLFALVSVVMAAVGIYGVISYLMSQRTREIATRMAFGAAPSDVRALLVRRSGSLALVGVLLGLAMTWAGGRFIGLLLPEVSPWDPVILLAATFIVLCIAFIALFWPALRASTMEPATGLGEG